MKKVILIDSYAFFYKVYYAFANHPLRNKKGENTSVIFAFCSFIQQILVDFSPDLLICVLDSKGKTLRVQLDENYKANRKPMPEELIPQIKVIKEILLYLGIPFVACQGYEADDIIAKYVKEAEKFCNDIFIFSSDKDLMQLVNEKTKLITTDKKSKYNIIDSAKVLEKFKVLPQQMGDLLALIGDDSDNIPGVNGIGMVTASKLLKQYLTLENIFDNINNIKGAVKKKLEIGKEFAFLSRKLVALNTNIDGIPNLLNIEFTFLNVKKLLETFNDYELFSLIERYYLKSSLPSSKKTLLEWILENKSINENKAENLFSKEIGNPFNFTRKEIKVTEFEDLKSLLLKAKVFAFDLETTSLDPFVANIVAVVFVIDKNRSFYVRLIDNNNDYEALFLKIFQGIFENVNIKKIGHNIKFEHSILAEKKIDLQGIYHDTMIFEHMLSPDNNKIKLDDLIENYLNFCEKISYQEMTKGKESILKVEEKKLKEYTFQDGEGTYLIYKEQLLKWKENSLEKAVFYELDLPFVSVLSRMEREGVVIDIDLFKGLEALLLQLIEVDKKNIYTLTKEEFNINSPKQLQEVLFEKIGIKSSKKTKTGLLSTDSRVLEKLAKQHEEVAFILKYRKKSKLLSTYVQALPKLLNLVTKKIHTGYNQAVTATGRLSSNNPNLQNIPIGKDSFGIRKGFVAPKGYKFVSLDYSQVELRILAYLSKDEKLLATYKEKKDIHLETAGIIFNKLIEDVSLEERNVAKTINFSVIYGVSAYSLAESLSISNQEAKFFIDTYFLSYSKVKIYMNKILEKARESLFVSTYYGRKRWVPFINSSQYLIRTRWERIAFNTIIQGTASDIIKKAMINIDKKIEANEIKAKLVMQVHDELVFYIKEEDVVKAVSSIEKELINIEPFANILEVTTNIGDNWEK